MSATKSAMEKTKTKYHVRLMHTIRNDSGNSNTSNHFLIIECRSRYGDGVDVCIWNKGWNVPCLVLNYIFLCVYFCLRILRISLEFVSASSKESQKGAKTFTVNRPPSSRNTKNILFRRCLQVLFFLSVRETHQRDGIRFSIINGCHGSNYD